MRFKSLVCVFLLSSSAWASSPMLCSDFFTAPGFFKFSAELDQHQRRLGTVSRERLVEFLDALFSHEPYVHSQRVKFDREQSRLLFFEQRYPVMYGRPLAIISIPDEPITFELDQVPEGAFRTPYHKRLLFYTRHYRVALWFNLNGSFVMARAKPLMSFASSALIPIFNNLELSANIHQGNSNDNPPDPIAGLHFSGYGGMDWTLQVDLRN